MSFRAARHVFSATARSSIRPVNASSIRMGAKRLNSSHAPQQSSDRPWIIASAFIFGPAFLYLISPSARKSSHSEHHDSHGSPGHQTPKAAEPPQETEVVKLKDDEGTEADVTGSLHQAEAEDVPKAGGAEPSISETESALEDHATEGKDDAQSEQLESTQTTQSVSEGKRKSETSQETDKGSD